jgi:hypothetical protein
MSTLQRITALKQNELTEIMVSRAIISHNNVPINNVLRQVAKGRIKKD